MMKGSQVNVPMFRKLRKKKVKKNLRRRSRGMGKKMVEYMVLKEEFLKEHPYCQHFMCENFLSEDLVILNNGWGKVGSSVLGSDYIKVPCALEIHHKRGRGRFLLDTSTWMACRPGHSVYIHGDPKEAYAKGYMLPR